MNKEELAIKWQKEMKKGFAKPLLLKAISKGKSYPYRLSKTINEETHGQINIATTNIYPLLKDLVDDGLITKFDDAETFRTYYQITDSGREFLTLLEATVKDFMQTMEFMLFKEDKK